MTLENVLDLLRLILPLTDSEPHACRVPDRAARPGTFYSRDGARRLERASPANDAETKKPRRGAGVLLAQTIRIREIRGEE